MALPVSGCVPTVRGRASSARRVGGDLVRLDPHRHRAARRLQIFPDLAPLHVAPVAAAAQREREPGPGVGAEGDGTAAAVGRVARERTGPARGARWR